jgi:hypothetical protein
VRRLLILCALLIGPSLLIGPALLPQRAFLPADLLVQFEPWRSHTQPLPEAHWDALVWDGIAQFYPWRHFAAESLRHGVIPLWNPYQFCGTPFLANGQSAVLYPLNLLFWLLPVYYAFGWSAWLHLCLTGWFMYRLLRRVGAGRVPALCGSVVWQLNSFTVAWIHLPTVLCTIAWLPAVLLMCERALVSGRARFGVAAGVTLGLSYLGGHPQMFLYVALMTAAYVIARGLSRTVSLPIVWRFVRLAWLGVLVAAVGLGLAAAQLLPTMDFLRLAHRAVTIGPESYRAFLSRAFQGVQLAGLLAPHPFGHPGLGTYVGPENYADYCLYVGIVALAIAVAAAFICRTWHARFFALAALASLLIALGTALNWPLYHWVPGMASAGGPSRIAMVFVFSTSLLVGLGAGRISDALRRPRLRSVAMGALLIVLLADLMLAARGHLHIVPREWVYSEAANPGPVLVLRSEGASPLRRVAEGRVIANAVDWPLRQQFPDAVLPPNAATVYHLRDVGGYDSLYLAHYRDFASLVQGGDPSPPANGNMILFRLGLVYGLDMTRLAGVTDVVSRDRVSWLRPDAVAPVYRYRDPLAWPRAWTANAAVSLPTHREAFDALARLGASQDYLVISGKDEGAEAGSSAAVRQPALSEVEGARDLSPNAVEVTLSAGGGYLFLADSYAPGWHTYAEGKALRVMPADVTFRVVAVPRPAKEVVFRYEPASFRVGLFVSLVTLAVALGVGTALWAQRSLRD